MNKKKKIYIVFFSSFVGLLLLLNFQCILNLVSLTQNGVTCGKRESASKTQIDNCFHEVFCDDDYIYYRCDLIINNHEKKEKTINVKGILLIDYLCGYIQNPFLELVDTNNNTYDITLLPEESHTYKSILFRAERGDCNNETLKFNRHMPWIVLM